MAFEIDVMTVVLWLAAAALAVIAWRKGEGRLRAAFATTGGLMAQVATRLPLALLMAGFLSQVMPGEIIAGAVGERSGITGIVIASLAGGLVPSGPFVSFPVALTLLKAGAGMPHLIAFVTGWGIFAFHRVLVYEWPLMGLAFTGVRLAASALIPPLTGVLALALWTLW